jgi:urease accessory protein
MMQTDILALQRAQGRAFVAVAQRRGQVRLADLAQAGSARVMLPRIAGTQPEAVFLNTAGGLTSGDRLEFAMQVGAAAGLTGTTQTAERAYRATGGAAHMRVRAGVGPAARLDWLPQDTILFEDCALDRDTRIDLAPGAACLLVETVVLGRRAMGEAPRRARLHDRRHVTIQGRPVWAESVRLDAAALAQAATPAMLGPAVAFATLALCAAGAAEAVAALRAVPVPGGVQAAASGWNGRCVLRATAADPWPLRQFLGRCVARLTGRPLPRVWQMQGVSP